MVGQICCLPGQPGRSTSWPKIMISAGVRQQSSILADSLLRLGLLLLIFEDGRKTYRIAAGPSSSKYEAPTPHHYMFGERRSYWIALPLATFARCSSCRKTEGREYGFFLLDGVTKQVGRRQAHLQQVSVSLHFYQQGSCKLCDFFGWDSIRIRATSCSVPCILSRHHPGLLVRASFPRHSF